MTEKRFTKQEVYDGINRYRINESNFIVEILDDGIPMHYSTIVNRLNEQHKTITRLEKENEQLKSIKKFADRNGICIFNIDEAFRRCWQDNAKLVKENEELKEKLNEILELTELTGMIHLRKAEIKSIIKR